MSRSRVGAVENGVSWYLLMAARYCVWAIEFQERMTTDVGYEQLSKRIGKGLWGVLGRCRHAQLCDVVLEVRALTYECVVEGWWSAEAVGCAMLDIVAVGVRSESSGGELERVVVV
ncbi:hypothetical protein Tco_1256245 [Tanacetum coccineum]